MRHKIWNIIKNASIIFTVLLVLTFVLHAFAITITPGTQFIVGNETYTVYQTMDFHTIVVGPSYIIFNTTGFYISSDNDITITLVYLSDDIYGASDGDKILEFYADTTSGTVSFSLSGFPAGNEYKIDRSGSTIGIPTANASGYISFDNSVWSEHLFEIFQEGVVNNPPVVSNIPDQTILEGESFVQIDLDDYVSDVEDPDEDIDWSYSGNTELLVSIVERVATISTPNSNWYGVETITFTAEDVGGLTDSDDATFTVTAVNDPPVVSGIPDKTIDEGGSFATIALDDYVEDPDNIDSEMIWTYSGNTNLTVSIDSSRVATIGIPDSDWYGSEIITFRATDPDGLWDEDSATFTVNAVNDPPFVGNIPGQSILEGGSFVEIVLDDYVSDVDNSDDEMTWTYSGNTNLTVSIDSSRVATIGIPDLDWYGSEIITFTAEDTGGLTDSDDATFTVTAVNDPPVVSNIPDQTILEGESFVQIDLDDYVSDVEDPDEDIDWSYSGNTELLVSIVERVATISVPNSEWYGVETITFTAEDTGGLTDSDDAAFMVTALGAPFFSGLSINNGAEGVSVSTSSLSIIIEDPDGDSFNWTIETSPNIGSNSGSNDSNGTKSCIISDLAYFTTYHWFVNATDGTHWTNGSYSFTTTTAPSYGQPAPPSYLPIDDEEQNNPPETPIKPSGPTFVEIGVEYNYSSSTFDVDGNQISFRFDWGDGNFSDWSDFVVSNASVSMSHNWSSILTYEVRVIAQDTDGLTSNWSPALNVTVSQAGLGIPPVVVINVSGNFSVNETIVFNASGSYDPDGFIVSYVWDFGDGETGSGISPVHVYKEPGEYTVTLMVTDNNNATYSKSIIVTVASGVEELGSGEQRGVPLFDFALIIIGFAMAVLACLAIFFRDHVKVFVSTRIIPLFSNMRISNREHEIEKVDFKINKIYEEMKLMRAEETVSKQLLVRKIAGFYGGIKEGYIGADSEMESTGEEKKSFDEFDKFRTGEKFDKLVRQGLKPDKLSVEELDRRSSKDFDVEVMVDKFISAALKEKPRMFDTAKEYMLSEEDEDSIEKKVDDLLISKEMEKNDTL